jgi:hypothetical protein
LAKNEIVAPSHKGPVCVGLQVCPEEWNVDAIAINNNRESLSSGFWYEFIKD